VTLTVVDYTSIVIFKVYSL